MRKPKEKVSWMSIVLKDISSTTKRKKPQNLDDGSIVTETFSEGRKPTLPTVPTEKTKTSGKTTESEKRQYHLINQGNFKPRSLNDLIDTSKR
jgi:hypothetical protein